MAEKMQVELTNGVLVESSKDGWNADFAKGNRVPKIQAEGWALGSNPHLSLSQGFLLGAVKKIPSALTGEYEMDVSSKHDGSEMITFPVVDADIVFTTIVNAGCETLGIEKVEIARASGNRTSAKKALESVGATISGLPEEALASIKESAKKDPAVRAALIAMGVKVE